MHACMILKCVTKIPFIGGVELSIKKKKGSVYGSD